MMMPIAAFWLTAGYHFVVGDTTLSKGDQDRNGALTPGKMVVRMLQINVMHVVGTMAGIRLSIEIGLAPPVPASFTFRWWTFPLGIFAMDTVQYFCHRAMHTYPTFYRFHKTHHELRALHSFGALYNSLWEVVITGGTLGLVFYGVLQFTPFEFAVISSISFIATVEEHTPSNGKLTRHWIHHNVNPNSNFQQPFFGYWDKLLGTYFDPKLSKKK